MDMEIKDARIINVIVEPNAAGMRFGLELDLYDGIIWQTPCRTITPEDEGIKTLCDVVGARAIIELIGAHIRVLRDNRNAILLIGNVSDNKWVDLERFTLTYLSPEGLDILGAHKANNREREEINMVMEIKDARIVTAFLKKKGDLYEFLLDIDLYDGIRYLAPDLLITHEEICTFFDVVGLRSGVSIRNTPIRVLADDEGNVLLFGNSMDNKWVDLKRFEIRRIKEETTVPYTEDEKEKERKQK